MTAIRPDRLRLAELTSGVGAVVLGVGLGVLAADHIGSLGLPLLLVGAAVHAWGMFDKHRLGRQADAPEVWWEPAAYWTCWGLLALLAVGLAGRLSGIV
ncbi:hypothetical protein KHP60_09855 [Microvirga sp. 3-52]|uniref:hypothetical protein n=1 Tax=Microvirga sp. 3-52 TaxID=2792425 RepID=UPI001ACD3A0E|nr:hypothetical protein [Microvirga sp. 3-52]MBO1905272.1 hypothetical protein [Microvirga sp. 3-52]MBS7452639.1 hypothetical protein [Microvirga sp. 3-52]